MEKEYWQARWNNKHIEFDQAVPNPFLVKFIDKLNLKAGSRIFVPLCGKSIDMFWLAQKGYQVIGIELHLEACHAFFQQNNLEYSEEKNPNFTILKSNNITLISGDFFELNKNLIGNIDAIYDRAALVALPQEMRIKYVNHLKQLMSPNTEILLITAGYNQNEMQGPPFSVDEAEVDKLFKQNLKITHLHHEEVKEIPPHLKAKGLTGSHHLVFMLSLPLKVTS